VREGRNHITALSAETLARSQIHNINQIQHITPGLLISQNPGQGQVQSVGMRGQIQTDAYITLDPAVGLYLDGVYLARCVYGFPTKDVKGRERVALVIGDGDGRDITRFTIDLAQMR